MSFIVNLYSNFNGVMRGTYGRTQQALGWLIVAVLPGGLLLWFLFFRKRK